MKCNSVGLVLQLSRLFGIAPYAHGSEYHVSRAIDICGKIVLTCASIISPLGVIYNKFYNFEHLGLTLDITHVGCRVLIGIIVFTGTFTAAGRITRISQILKQLEQIDLNVRLRRKTSVNRKMFFIVFIYMTTAFVLRVLHMLHIIFIDHYNIFWPLLNLLVYQIAIFLEIQFITLAARVLLTLETINVNLEDLIPAKYSITMPDIKPTVPTVAWENIGDLKINTMKFHKKSNMYRKGAKDKCNVDLLDANVALTVRQLAINYFKICEIVRAITKKEGFLIILLFLYHMLHVEGCWYKIIIGISAFEGKYYLVLPSIGRGIIDMVALILCTEPFHQTHVQMDRTHLIINYLKCRSRDNEEVSNELETFLRLLLLNKTTYSPLSVCTLARSLVVKIYGSLVTYLVIILTYGPEMSHPTLAIANKKAFA